MIWLYGYQLWDVSTGQEFTRYSGHEKKAWSVDFSQVYPTKLASGSDDGSVKLWSINEVCSLINSSVRKFMLHDIIILIEG